MRFTSVKAQTTIIFKLSHQVMKLFHDFTNFKIKVCKTLAVKLLCDLPDINGNIFTLSIWKLLKETELLMRLLRSHHHYSNSN